jgi:hypothetical protein
MLQISMKNCILSSSQWKSTNSFSLRSPLLRLESRQAAFAQGASLVEALIAIFIVSFAVIVTSSIINSLASNIKSSEEIYDTQNIIDSNISKIESAADRYICGSTTCTVIAGSAIPAKNQYIDVLNSTAWVNFKTRCEKTSTTGGADLISPLISYIESSTDFALPTSISRQITAHGAEVPGFARVRHLTVQYREGSASGNILRDVTIMPTIVAYCP